jgi:hypothetical protein
MVAPESRGWERYAWLGGAVFVVALVAEFIVVAGVPLSLNDSEAKITAGLQDHHRRLILVACLSILYAPAFVIYLSRLHDLLREHTTHSRFLLSWVLVGAVVWVTLHTVSDIGITGMVGAKIAVNAYTASHDHSGPYNLYLLTFALDSVADVFGSLFVLATGLLLLRTHLLPRWQAWTAILAAPFLFTQAFGLGGVIATFGLVLDLVGFLALLIFVLASSLTLFTRSNPARRTASAPEAPERRD